MTPKAGVTAVRVAAIALAACVALLVGRSSPAEAQGLVPLGGLLPTLGAPPDSPPSRGTAPTSTTPSPGNAASGSAAPNPGGVPTGSVVGSTTGAIPIAWIDDGSVLAPGDVAVSISALRWQGSGVSQMGFPVGSMALGLAPRVQVSATVPRLMDNTTAGGAPGGLGTMFLSGKISVLDTTRLGMVGVRLAVAPTLEVVGPNAARVAGRTRWGAPVSLEISGAPVLVFTSAGHFSGGTWFAGGGLGGHVTDRVGASASFSRAWTAGTAVTPSRTRNEVSGGAAFSVTPHVIVSGSIARTIATAVEDGAGTTVSAGLSFVRQSVFRGF